jgi:hypothetical protein
MRDMNRVEELLEIGEQLLAALDEFGTDSGPDLSACELGELSVGLVGIADRLHARHSTLTRAGEVAGTHEIDGSTSMTAWLARQANTQRSRACTLVGTGRFLTAHPVLANAALEGTITAAHVTRLRSACDSPAAAESLCEPDTQDTLVEHAQNFAFDDWVRLVRRWNATVDPDGTEDKAAATHEARNVTIHPEFAGTGYTGEIKLGNLDGAMLT